MDVVIIKMINLKKLQEIRKNKGLTGTALAKKIGITPSHYNNIERGNKGISTDTLAILCKVLDIDISDIWSSEDNSLPPIFPVRDEGVIIERNTIRFIFPQNKETYEYITKLVAEKNTDIDITTADADFQTVLELWNNASQETKTKIIKILRETSGEPKQ
jgi:transcriptional regulator with XRE-family HTH domain